MHGFCSVLRGEPICSAKTRVSLESRVELCSGTRLGEQMCLGPLITEHLGCS